METETTWVPLEEFNFENENLVEIHIDTRDFNVLGKKEPSKPCIEYPTRAVSIEKIKESVFRFKETSGGEREWRHFDIVGTKYSNGWDFKYLRFKKSSEGWLFINDDYDKVRNQDSAYPAEYLDNEGIDWEEWYDKNNPRKEQDFEQFEDFVHEDRDSYMLYENYYSSSTYQRPSQFVRDVPKVQNNEMCSCNSGKKFKKCCKK